MTRTKQTPHVQRAPLAAGSPAAAALVRGYVAQQARIAHHRRQREDWERLHPPKASTPYKGTEHARLSRLGTL